MCKCCVTYLLTYTVLSKTDRWFSTDRKCSTQRGIDKSFCHYSSHKVRIEKEFSRLWINSVTSAVFCLLMLALMTILETDWDKLVLLLADSLSVYGTIMGSAVKPRSLSTELLFSQLFCMAARNCTDIIHWSSISSTWYVRGKYPIPDDRKWFPIPVYLNVVKSEASRLSSWKQFRWTGHVIRMEDDRIPKRTFYGQMTDGTHSTGGQLKRFKDSL